MASLIIYYDLQISPSAVNEVIPQVILDIIGYDHVDISINLLATP